jgi:HSP20 family molecular chaperone IbpA
MSSPVRTLKNPSRPPTAKTEILADEDGRGFLDEFYNLVARRAYDRFERDGRADGNDTAHWLDAERELAAPRTDVRDSTDSFTAVISLPDAPAGSTKVYAAEDRAIVYTQNNVQGDSDGKYERSESTYYMIRWPEIVDPGSCSAQMDDQRLTITVHKAEVQSQTGTESSEGL